MIQPKNLLIVRTDRIGDVVLSLPLAGIIKKHFPSCRITFLLREYTKSLAQDNPFIDNILTLDELNTKIPIKGNASKLKKYNFDTSIVVYPTFITALIIFLSGIKNRIGTGYRWYSFLFNKRVFVHRKYAEKHELEFNIDMLKKFGITEKITPENIAFDIHLTKDSEGLVRKELENNNIRDDKPLIIIHPGSGGSAVDLPLLKFKDLISLLINSSNVNIVLTGSKAEKKLCEELKISENIINFAGKFDLHELIALINLSDIFVANSTGPLHISAALGKYVIGFYPKILACSAKRWGPYSLKSYIFEPEIQCENCTREQCTGLDCMNSIDIHKVFVQIEKILGSIKK